MAFLDLSGLSRFLAKCKTIFVPMSRTVNSKALSSDITLSASDVGAAPSSTVSCTTANVKSALGTGSGTSKFLREDGTWQYTPNVYYGECSTTASTQTKVVSIPKIESLTTGLCVRVKFLNAQDYSGQPQLQINSLEAKYILRSGSDSAKQYDWQAGEVLDFVYNGTSFIIQGGAVPTTTYYGSRIKLSSSTSSTSEDLAATPKAVKTAYDLANGKVSCTKSNIDSALGTGTGATKFYREDGTWNVPPGAKPYVVELGSVTNTSGYYYRNFFVSNVRDDMKPIQIEVSDPDVFQDEIVVSTGSGSITVTCDHMSGTSDITVTLMESASAEQGIPGSVTSNEFNTLASRIGTLSSLTTTTKTDLVAAANELNSKLTIQQGTLTIDTTKVANESASEPSFIMKQNNVITLNIHARTQAQIAAWSDIGVTIPTGYRTYRVFFAVGIVDGTAYGFRFGTDGSILIQSANAIPSNKKIDLFVTYIA